MAQQQKYIWKMYSERNSCKSKFLIHNIFYALAIKFLKPSLKSIYFTFSYMEENKNGSGVTLFKGIYDAV